MRDVGLDQPQIPHDEIRPLRPYTPLSESCGCQAANLCGGPEHEEPAHGVAGGRLPAPKQRPATALHPHPSGAGQQPDTR